MTPLVEAAGLNKSFGPLHAVRDVDLSIARGETVGIVGESGCGKSTLGRLLLRLVEPTSGVIRFDNADMTALSARDLRLLRRRMQMVFQDPYASLDPRCTVGASVAEPLRIQGLPRRGRAAELLALVGLRAGLLDAYPHQLSGGQRQRVGIARALALSPDFVVLDEPTASLDVSVQAQVVGLLESLRARLGLTYAFISHNLPLVDYLADRVVVMYLGRIVEVLPAPGATARHHYTRALRASTLDPDPRLRRDIARDMGEMPSPFEVLPGCSFAPRCPAATAQCRAERPALSSRDGQLFACHHPWST